MTNYKFYTFVFTLLLFSSINGVAQQLVWEENFDGAEVPENIIAYTTGELVLEHSIVSINGNNALKITGDNEWNSQTQFTDLSVDVSGVPVLKFKYKSKTEKDEKFRLSVEIFRDGGSTGTFYPEFMTSPDEFTEATMDISAQIFGTTGVVTGFTIWLDPSHVLNNTIEELILDDIILGGIPPDETAPLLSGVTTGQLDIGLNATATSNEDGSLYLVPSKSSADIDGFNTLVNNSEAKMVDCSSNEATAINTTGLTNGFYTVYAVDKAGNISLPSEKIIVGVMPVLSNLTTGTINIGDDVNATSNVDADLYLIPSSTEVSIENFQQQVEANVGIMITGTANTPTTFSTDNLTDNQYTVYAIDANLNISEPSESILIGSLSNINIIIKPTEYEYAVKNPLKGFRKRLHNSSHPLVSLERFYIKWNDIENDESDGIEKIKAYCNEIWKDLPARNNKAIPRVYLHWDGERKYWPADMQEDDYTSEQFISRLKRLIERLGECWDNDSRVAYIEMGFIGKWGEQHSPTPTEEVQWILGEAFRKNFPNKKVMVRNISEPLNPWQSSAANVLNLFNFGVYWDAYGTDEQWGNEFYKLTEPPLNKRWETEVMGGEVSYNYGTPFGIPVDSPDNNPDYSVTHKTQDVINMIRKIHTNHLGWISDYTVGPLTEAGAHAIHKAFGYRFVIDKASYPALLNTGQEFEFTFHVTNTGSTPFYYQWPVEISLLDPQTKEVVWNDVFKNIDITQWMPGDKWSDSQKKYTEVPENYRCTGNFTLPSNINSSEYIVALAILDPAGMRPAARFAIKNYFNGGRHPIGKVGVETVISNYTIDVNDFDDLKSDFSLNYDKEAFDIPLLTNVTSGKIADSETVKATCNQDATIYIVPQFTAPSHIRFEQAIALSKGLKIEGTKDIAVEINPATLESGKYIIYALNTDGYITQPSEIIIIGQFPEVYDALSGEITKGTVVTAKSTMDGYMFLVPTNTIPMEDFLNNAVINRLGKKALATADGISQFGTSLIDAGNYYIYAVDESGNVSLPSEMVTITLPNSIEKTTNNSVNIYPNPASENLQIANCRNNSIISIYNIYGQQIANYKTVSNRENLDISGLKSGIYLIKIQQENGDAVTVKFVKE